MQTPGNNRVYLKHFMTVNTETDSKEIRILSRPKFAMHTLGQPTSSYKLGLSYNELSKLLLV